ncbi:MAG: TIGR02646 family protein [Alicyclobacillus sp.]|nr:TIGR02646 family protein [Alicyclobacillus sp.]
MRYIVKDRIPAAFKLWKTEYHTRHRRRPTYASLNRNVNVKHLVQESLIREQHHVCCYCGIPITLETSHIEHFKPQSRFPNLALDYGNLHASCQYRDSCGHNKGTAYGRILSPLQPDCETYLHYREDGKVEVSRSIEADPWKRDTARNTIQRLGLNTDRLVARRRAVIEGYLGDGFLNFGELQALIRLHELPDSEGHYLPFSAAVISVLRDFLSSSVPDES